MTILFANYFNNYSNSLLILDINRHRLINWGFVSLRRKFVRVIDFILRVRSKKFGE